MRYASDQFYLKTPEEMHALFGEIPEAISNTVAIAEKCNFIMEFGKLRYPAYDAPKGMTRDQYLLRLCQEGLHSRYGIDINAPKDAQEQSIISRLKHELHVIEIQGFTSYFLIVWDFVHFARTHDIPVGPGRGSAAGSLVAYLLKITDIDPLRYGLFFERFLNPERKSPPDIDMDFCYNRRPEVIDYVRKKYGETQVAQIITFGTLGAKMVVRDVGRVLGLPYAECDRISKMIPFDPSMTLHKALEISPELKQAYQSEDNVRRVIDYGFTLEGLARNSSTHAAGVVIGGEPLTNIVPLTRGSNESEIVTQYSMNPLGDLGLLKMDFLGLKTLTVIKDAIDYAAQTTGNRIDIGAIPLDDQKTFDLIKKANTIGVFQLESGGMRDLCRRIGIGSIDNINALVALYRPGPMQFIDDYIARKHGKVAVTYEHPALEPILQETYGIFVYQEQVMQAANVLAGYSLGAADLLRRAMGKKKPEEMEKQRAIFVKGCDAQHKIPKAHAEKIFDILAKFAGYGFNKSHSAAYAVVAYQTAWLKANYPVEFMAALLSNELANTDKIQLLINECRSMGIEVLSPDVNESNIRFSVVPAAASPAARHSKAIRFGLAAIKNVGEIAVQNIIEARAKDGPFKTFDEFCERVDLRTVNRKVLENLCKCGALDSLAPPNSTRSNLFSEIDWQMNRASAIQRDRQRGQSALFAIEPINVRRQMPNAETTVSWTESEMLAFEKELLGFYVSGHPLARYADILRRYDLTPTNKLGDLKDGDAARLGGIISNLQLKTTKQGKPMAIITLEDLDGTVETLAFSEAYTKYTANIQPDAAVYVCGTVNRREEPPKIYADQILKLDDVPRRFTKAVHIRIPVANTNDFQLERIRDILHQHTGACPVVICFIYPDGRLVFLEADDRLAVTPSAGLIASVESLIGEQTVYLKVDTDKLLAPPVSPKQRFANFDGRKNR
jgi:DNA polymerase-3 subunit alpha